MRKRLLKKISGIEDLRFVQLKELDEADIKLDRCPICKSQPLEKKDGFKRCLNCGNVYKMFDGEGYIVSLQ